MHSFAIPGRGHGRQGGCQLLVGVLCGVLCSQGEWNLARLYSAEDGYHEGQDLCHDRPGVGDSGLESPIPGHKILYTSL
jgi:hypothetical protein